MDEILYYIRGEAKKQNKKIYTKQSTLTHYTPSSRDLATYALNIEGEENNLNIYMLNPTQNLTPNAGNQEYVNRLENERQREIEQMRRRLNDVNR